MSKVDQIIDRFLGSRVVRAISPEKLTVRDAFRRVFDNPDGKVVLNYLIRHSHVIRSTYSKGNHDLMMIREGERRSVLTILKLVYGRQELQETIEENMQDAS